jgi:hypothetical protein
MNSGSNSLSNLAIGESSFHKTLREVVKPKTAFLSLLFIKAHVFFAMFQKDFKSPKINYPSKKEEGL